MKLGHAGEMLHDIRRLFAHLSRRRRIQLAALLGLQIIGAVSEVIGLGAVLPFLGALANADQLLADPDLQWIFLALNIATAENLIVLTACAFGAAVAIVNAVRVVTLWAQTQLAAVIGSDLSIEVYRRLLHQPYEFHTGTNSGNLISVTVNDLNATLSVVMNCLMIITQGLVAVAIIFALLAFNPKIALSASLLTILLYIAISKITRAHLATNSQAVSDGNTQIVRTLQEGIGGIRDIILNRSQDVYVMRYGRGDRAMRRASATIQLLRMVPRYFIESVGIVLLSILTVVLTTSEGDFRNILPVLGGLAMAANRLLPAAQQIYASYAGIQGSHFSMKRSLTALERPRDPRREISTNECLSVKSSVELRDIWFRYGTDHDNEEMRRWVIRGLSLSIPANKVIALVGKTGGGKSTLADIILGLLHPERGSIHIDGIQLTAGNLSQWSNTVAHVPQSIYLSDATVKENIAFGIPAAAIDMGKVRKAAQMAQVDAFIEGMPNGYDEQVGERGIRLSGGQRQRLGIARALYRQAAVVVFDEATSALDNSTERSVMDAIGDLAGQVTVVLIAHRLSTIRAADLIYQIEDGAIAASGSYDELMKNSPTFRHMVEAVQTQAADAAGFSISAN